VLAEIGAEGKPMLMVLNKVDLVPAGGVLSRFLERHPHAAVVSAKTGEGIPELMGELGSALRPIREFLELAVPHGRWDIIARLHEVGHVVERDYEGEYARFKVRIPPHFHHEFQKFVVKALQTA